jgi:ABC-type Fe3+ transport system substrate-binding protein
MAEVFRTDQAGETAQLFIQFVMMQHQQALFAMGKHPNTPPNAPPPNPKLARLFIDQLSMIRSKTEGNLSPEEERVIDSALAELRAAYATVTGSEE